MDMIPCKDCITYSICRARIIDCLPEYYNIAEEKEIAFIIALAFYRYLELKCCLISDYVNKAIDETHTGLNINHDKLICNILWEAFNL